MPEDFIIDSVYFAILQCGVNRTVFTRIVRSISMRMMVNLVSGPCEDIVDRPAEKIDRCAVAECCATLLIQAIDPSLARFP